MRRNKYFQILNTSRKNIISFFKIKGSRIWLLFNLTMASANEEGHWGASWESCGIRSIGDQLGKWPGAQGSEPLFGNFCCFASSIGGMLEACLLSAFYSPQFFSLYNAICFVHNTFSTEPWENNAEKMVETCVWMLTPQPRSSPVWSQFGEINVTGSKKIKSEFTADRLFFYCYV